MGINYTENEVATALRASSTFPGIEKPQTTQIPDLCIRPVILLSANLQVYPFLPSILIWAYLHPLGSTFDEPF